MEDQPDEQVDEQVTATMSARQGIGRIATVALLVIALSLGALATFAGLDYFDDEPAASLDRVVWEMSSLDRRTDEVRSELDELSYWTCLLLAQGARDPEAVIELCNRAADPAVGVE